jgi:hypothetical protein
MSHLTARLEALLHLYAAADDRIDDVRWVDQFRKDLALPVAEYGPKTVDAALDGCRTRRGHQSPCIDP